MLYTVTIELKACKRKIAHPFLLWEPFFGTVSEKLRSAEEGCTTRRVNSIRYNSILNGSTVAITSVSNSLATEAWSILYGIGPKTR